MAEDCPRRKCAARKKVLEMMFELRSSNFKMVCTMCRRFVRINVTSVAIEVDPNG